MKIRRIRKEDVSINLHHAAIVVNFYYNKNNTIGCEKEQNKVNKVL